MSQADETIPAAWADVLAERRRQIEAEGWAPEHDDKHTRGDLTAAAANYAAMACLALNASCLTVCPDERPPLTGLGYSAGWPYGRQYALNWPWKRSWWKPGGVRRMLVKAGALILAEIERLDRAALLAQEADHGR